MEFNLLSHGTSFDMGSEVYSVAPLLMFADSMAYFSDQSGFLVEAFNPMKLTDEQVARVFKSFYPAAQHPGVEKFDLVGMAATVKRLNSIKNKSHKDLVAIGRIKKVLRIAREDVERFNRHYMTQFGFDALKPFVESKKLFATFGFGIDGKRGTANTLEIVSAALTEEENALVLTQDIDKVLKVHILSKKEKASVAPDVACIPFISFPVLKRLTQEQIMLLHQSLSSAASAFNKQFEEMQKKTEESLFSGQSVIEFSKQSEELILPHREELQKIIDDNIYVKQLRNSSPEDGEVHFYIGLSSIKNVLDSYLQLGLFEPYVMTGILNRISTEGRSADQALMFLYVRSTALEVNKEALKKFIPELQ